MHVVNPLQADAHEHWLKLVPGWKRACRRCYDFAALRLMTPSPAQGIRRLGIVGAAAQAAGAQGPSTAEVLELFPSFSRSTAARLASRIADTRFRNRAAIALVAHGGVAALAELLLDEDASEPPLMARRTGGVILAAFHLGAHFGVGAALHRWGTPCLSLPDQPLIDVETRARNLKLAVESLREGRAVLAALDAPGGSSTVPVPCLGRRVVLRRGPLALARLSGAPILPIVAQWTPEGRIRVTLGEPLDLSLIQHGSFEERAALAAAAWLERHVASHPGDLWAYTLRNLSASPRFSAGERSS